MNPLKSHERALRFGKQRFNLETGFIHEENGFISLYHNFCYALALLRSYQKEAFEEAKLLLTHLLPFQKNGFPLWLHRFPEESWESSFNCLIPLYWIQKHFSKYFPSELKTSLQHSFSKLCDFCQKTASAPPHLRVKYQGIMQERATAIEARSADEWGHYLLAAELFDDDELLAKAFEIWDISLRTYAGPMHSEYYFRGEPAPTLLDLALIHRLNIEDLRIYRESPLLLQGALLFSEKIEPLFSFPKNRFLIGGSVQKEKGWHLFRYLWGNSEKIFSLSSHERHLDLEIFEKGILITYPAEYSNEKSVELKMFCGPRESLFPKVNGKAATLFYLGDILTFETTCGTLSMQVQRIEGEGIFSGHIYPANRPSEISLEADQEQLAYDWCIGIRTLNREKRVVLKVQFEELDTISASVEENAGLSIATPIA